MLDMVRRKQGEAMHFGPQKLVFTPPNHGYLELVDPLTVGDAVNLINHIKLLFAQNGELYMLVNMSAVKELSRDVRQLADDAPNGYAGVAIWGTSFPMRVLTGMILRAARSLRPEALPYPVEFFASEAEAKAWLERLEREKAAK